jgi:predicted transcriptional regulator
MKREAVAKIATGIVISYLSSGKQAPVSDMRILVGRVCDALYALGAPPAPAPASAERGEPAVAVQESVTPDAVICLICGKKLITLRRHLGEKHRLLPAQYRWKFNLPEDYPMEATAYAKLRSDLAKASGLGKTVV